MSQAVVFYEYAGCSTCKKAKRWLDAHGVEVRTVPIVETPPKLNELEAWMKSSDLPGKKWFNTSGQSYRALSAELGKEAVAKLSDAEIRKYLAKDGKLIKRPLLIANKTVLVGFDEDAYAATFGKKT